MNIYNEFSFFNQLVLRTPSYSVNDKVCIENKEFKEMLYLSSPYLLHNEYKSTAQSSIKKYINRSKFRCTPFGLFAGCSVVEWSNCNDIKLDKSNFSRKTTLDKSLFMEIYRSTIIQFDLWKALNYKRNNTLYPIGFTFRYIECSMNGNSKKYEVAEIEYTEILKTILDYCNKIRSFQDISIFLQHMGFEKIEIENYLLDLVHNQIIVSDLLPLISDLNFLSTFIKKLSGINKSLAEPKLTHHINNLKIIDDCIKKLDNNKYNDINNYSNITDHLNKIGISYEENKVFHVERVQKAISNQINKKYQNWLKKAVLVLKYLMPSKSDSLDQFKVDFYNRYGDEEVPITYVFDQDSGLRYANFSKNIRSSLISGIKMNDDTPESYSIDPIRIWLINEINNALFLGKRIINIDYDNIPRNIFSKQTDDFTETFFILFKYLGIIDGAEKILFNQLRGPSGTNIISRFANSSNEILQLNLDICKHEQFMNDNAIIAEIIHVPEERIGNVLLKPVLRDFEIPIIDNPTVSENNQVPLDDLVLSLKNEKFILKSKKLNKRIIPRLSNAFNYHLSTLPIFRFLVDIQFDGYIEWIIFNWGVFKDTMTYLPRVEINNVVVSLATWNFTTQELAFVKKSFDKEIYNFWKKWDLPKKVIIVEADNELYVNINDKNDLEILKEYFTKKESVKLSEFLFDEKNQFTTDTKNNVYYNEFVAIARKD